MTLLLKRLSDDGNGGFGCWWHWSRDAASLAVAASWPQDVGFSIVEGADCGLSCMTEESKTFFRDCGPGRVGYVFNIADKGRSSPDGGANDQ